MSTLLKNYKQVWGINYKILYDFLNKFMNQSKEQSHNHSIFECLRKKSMQIDKTSLIERDGR